MSAKSPFEIRLDLLHLAQSILSDRSWQKRNVLEQNWNAQRENALIKTPVPPFPEMDSVTTEDIIAEAKKLNEFVSNG